MLAVSRGDGAQAPESLRGRPGGFPGRGRHGVVKPRAYPPRPRVALAKVSRLLGDGAPSRLGAPLPVASVRATVCARKAA